MSRGSDVERPDIGIRHQDGEGFPKRTAGATGTDLHHRSLDGWLWHLERVGHGARLFAAAIPICGGGDAASVRKFDKVPIWAFHNDGDPTVTVEGSRSMIAALKKAGGEPKYTEYQSTQHDAWIRTYKDPGLWEWLLSQKLR